MNSAYDEGLEARKAGRPETDNPYDDGSQEFLDWNDGWMAAGQEGRGYVCVAPDGRAIYGGPIERLTHDYAQMVLSEGYSIHPYSGAPER